MSINTVVPQTSTPLTLTLDAAAVSIVPLVFLKVLPIIATIFTIVYLGMQIVTWVVNKKWTRRNDG
jgi:hypothetical protein